MNSTSHGDDGMVEGTKVYRAYITTNGTDWWLDRGEISGITEDGRPLVRWAGSLVPLTDKWHTTEAGAKGDAARAVAVGIGKLQAKLDALRDEILHDTLATEEVTHGA
jgi:hypothetical protein